MQLLKFPPVCNFPTSLMAFEKFVADGGILLF
jgi:hypothetical protein